MKKIFRGATLIAILMIVLAMLTACRGRLNGSYLPESGRGYKFSGNYCYQIHTDYEDVGTGCPYKIKGGRLIIYFGNLALHDYEFQKSGSSIFLDGVEYKKQ